MDGAVGMARAGDASPVVERDVRVLEVSPLCSP